MTEQRKRELRQQYLKAQRILIAAGECYNCGLQLIEYIAPPEVYEALLTIGAIEREVKEAMIKEGKRHDDSS